QACHDVQDFTARQIALEQEIHDAKVEQQRLIDIANKEKQQQAHAEADRIRDEKIQQTRLQGAYMAMPRSMKDIVLKILSDNNLTVMTASNESLEMAITSAEIAAELSEQSVKDELKKRGIPLFPSGSPIHTSQADTSTTPAISSAIPSIQGIPIYTSSSSGFNLIPPHSSPNRVVITHPTTPPASPPPFNHTMSHSTPDPNAPVKTAVELEVERILNESRRQLQSDSNINLNLKPVSTKQTKYQRDCINRTNILVKFCDTSVDFDTFYTKISLYYGLKKTDNKFISEKDVILQKFKGDTLSQFLYHIEKFHKYSLQYFQKDETRFQVELEKTLIGSCLEHIMDGIPEEHNSYMLTIKTMIEFLASKNIKIIDREDIFSICPKIENESVTDIRNRLKINYGINHPNESHENANELINKFYSFLNIYICKKLKSKINEQETWSNNKATFSQISNLAIILEAEMNSPSNTKTKEDLIRKFDENFDININNKSKIKCTSNSETTSVITPNEPEVTNEPKVPKVKKVKKLNKNGNNKIFNKLIKQTPEVFLNPEQLDNFPIPTLKSSIKSNDPLNIRKKKVSFNKVNKCVKYGSFWEPIKLSETSVEKKVFIKFNKKLYNVDYVIDINELKSKTVKFDVLNNLKNNFNIDAKILQNSINNGNEIRQENLNLHETTNNTFNNKNDNNINVVSKGINYTVSSINYSYLLHNPNKPVKSTVTPPETISVNFSNILENNKFDNLNFKSCLTKNNKLNINLDSSNKLFNYSVKNNYNKFNNITDEIDDYGKSSIYYKYKLFHLNNEKLIKFKFLFCQLNQFIKSIKW
ncbi:unnamed protein product, partial [Rotaria magnacalcarata]